MEDPRRGVCISIEEAADAADAIAADAAAALQAMKALHESAPRSSGSTQCLNPAAPESMATVPQAQLARACVEEDDDDVAGIIPSRRPNPESYPCNRAKKMRLLSTIYSSAAARNRAVMH